MKIRNNYFVEKAWDILKPKSRSDTAILVGAVAVGAISGWGTLFWTLGGYAYGKLATRTIEPKKAPPPEPEPTQEETPPPSPKLEPAVQLHPILDTPAGRHPDQPPPLPTMRAYNPETDSAGLEKLQPPVGLPNAGNSCFLASISQALLLQTSDVETQLQENLKKLKEGSDEKAAAEILLQFIQQVRKEKSITHEEVAILRFVLPLLSEGFRKNLGEQQDAAQALEPLADLLCQWKIPFLQKVFQLSSEQPLLVEESTITNAKGEYLFLAKDPEWRLMVDLPAKPQEKPRLEPLIQNSFWRAYDGTEKIKRRSFDGELIEVPYVTERLQFSEPPEQLVVVLKRFLYDAKSKKIQGAIEIDEILELSGDYFATHEAATYRLDAAVRHHGKTDGGHYTAALRGNAPDLYHFANDSAVDQISQTSFKEEAENSYILVFHKI